MEATPRLWAKPELTEYIRRQGRLQTWIGSLIGKDKSFVTHVMKGRKSIRFSDAERISLALGVPDVYVLFDCASAPMVSADEVAA